MTMPWHGSGLVSSLTLGVVWGVRTPAPAPTGPSQRPEPERGGEQSELAPGGGRAGAASEEPGPPRPTPTIPGGPGPGESGTLGGSEGSSSYEPEWLWPWLLGFQRLTGRRRRRRRVPRPVTLGAGLSLCGPHSPTSTTLFVTLQRISCNIFLPPEIKQSGSNPFLRFMIRKITLDSYSISFIFRSGGSLELTM